jgi:hypothetical protein
MKLKLGLLSLLFGAVSMMASSLMVKDAHVRATPPMMKNTAAFMMIMNKTDKDVEIVSAKSNVAKNVELHTHENVKGKMKMYQVEKVDVKANAHVMFQPGGFHVMFLGLSKALKVGDSVDFSLVLSNGEEIKVTAPVKKVMTGMHHGGINKMDHGKSHKDMKKMNNMNHGKM